MQVLAVAFTATRSARTNWTKGLVGHKACPHLGKKREEKPPPLTGNQVQPIAVLTMFKLIFFISFYCTSLITDYKYI